MTKDLKQTHPLVSPTPITSSPPAVLKPRLERFVRELKLNEHIGYCNLCALARAFFEQCGGEPVKDSTFGEKFKFSSVRAELRRIRSRNPELFPKPPVE
jgi:hypothetical protein